MTNLLTNNPRYALGGALLLGLALRLVGIGAPLASDELASCSIWAQMPFSQIPANYQYPNNHIFLTLVLSAILKVFGVNEILLRLPVLLCGLASIHCAWRLAEEATKDRLQAVAAALVMAVSVNHVYYSTNARGYLPVMLAAQIVCLRLLRRASPRTAPGGETPWAQWREMNLFALLFFLGTWTLPTFALFPASVAVFVLSVAFSGRKSGWCAAEFPVARLIAVLIFSVIGLYLQYFVWIAPEMLKTGLANAAPGAAASYIDDILAEWVRPWEWASPAFAACAFLGFWVLWKKNPPAGALFACVLLAPPAAVLVAGAFKILPTLPHPRVFGYLQPVLFICTIAGALHVLERLTVVIRRLAKIPDQFAAGVAAILLAALAYGAIAELTNNVYPERERRERWPEVLKFLKNDLGANDLVLVSNRPHVAFYLYGAEEMRRRVLRIVETGRLGAVYFLEYLKDGVSDMKREAAGNGEFPVRLTDHSRIMDTGNGTNLEIPARLLEPVADFGAVRIHRLRAGALRKLSALDDPKDAAEWRVFSGEVKGARIEPLAVAGESRPAWRFRGNLDAGRPTPQAPDAAFALNLYLFATRVVVEYSSLFTSARIEDATPTGGRIALADAWLGNAWVMDHPYGPGVFRREWRTEVVLALPGSLALLHVQAGDPSAEGWARGLGVYQITDSPAPEQKIPGAAPEAP